MKTNNSSQKGFTLIELLVALTILGILLVAGVPTLFNLVQNMAARSTSDQFLNALNYARGEAVARVGNVTICSGLNCAGGVAWDNGWTVFVDFNGDGLISAGGVGIAADEVIRVSDNSANNTTIRQAAGTAVTRITYNRLGENQSPGTAVSFRVCGSNNDIVAARTIGVTTIGSGTAQSGTAVCP